MLEKKEHNYEKAVLVGLLPKIRMRKTSGIYG
jgi:hypothetical protein